MDRRVVLAIIAFALALLPGVAAAQDDAGGTIFRVYGTTTVAKNQSADTVVAISGDVVVDGTVNDTLVVIDGTATVAGKIPGDVNVISGTLDLKPGATVNNVTLVHSTLHRDPGATITGNLSRRSEFFNFGWGSAIFSFFFWVGTTIVVLVAGLIFAALGGRQLTEAGEELTRRLGESVIAGLIVWIGGPILGVLAFLTIIGIPLGLAIFVIALPALGFLGYIVAGTRLGAALIQAVGVTEHPNRPYLAAVVGLVALQIVGVIPIIGGIVVLLAGFLGSGALAALIWRGRHWRPSPLSRQPSAVSPQP